MFIGRQATTRAAEFPVECWYFSSACKRKRTFERKLSRTLCPCPRILRHVDGLLVVKKQTKKRQSEFMINQSCPSNKIGVFFFNHRPKAVANNIAIICVLWTNWFGSSCFSVQMCRLDAREPESDFKCFELCDLCLRAETIWRRSNWTKRLISWGLQ